MLARNLRHALTIRDLGLRALAARVGVNHATISRVLAGRRFCDASTLAKLEVGLDSPLWPQYRPGRGHSRGEDASAP
ncbi:helix-turn-helix domain-containing protein [Gordonia sp. (in: high G+C Gram-positive bacteria)]|uniref:helix-turn-helix domain-containing protein n=1 Tax=Gordonia sp. (in: high G+C Gram-positive bacteria) TaxID=84139 RepID=UPI003F961B3E